MSTGFVLILFQCSAKFYQDKKLTDLGFDTFPILYILQISSTKCHFFLASVYIFILNEGNKLHSKRKVKIEFKDFLTSKP